MSYWIHESGNKNNSLWRFYQCDYISDIEKLPTASTEGIPQLNDTVSRTKCSPGSQCFCQEDGSVWFLGKDTDKWIKGKSASSSGSSSGGSGGTTDSNIKPIPSSSIESLFP